MLIVERQKRMVEILRERRVGEVEGLARELGVSAATVRRDVEELERQGLVERTHGGVVFRPRNVAGMALEERMREMVGAKRAIGAAAAKQVRGGMTVYIDGGSTMHYCIGHIVARPLVVVTNSLTVAEHFAMEDGVELLVLGGEHYPRSGVLVGRVTMAAMAGLHADLMLFSCAGVWGRGVYNSNLAMAEVERVAFGQAARRVLLADSSKFGRKSLAEICALREVDWVVTDGGVGGVWGKMLAGRGEVVAGGEIENGK